ncbi:GNAT family N-acetyltransferase [Streptomyces sp. NPDC059506]|uniref:GNAT family N-acetyltransferase n=1 Tax=Streptomyces TaxID=1883 RepID=UPI0015F99A38|nr:GNAT family N-acyltransferase [Streptomyces sp. SCUT-3]QMV23630.1 GNAT family N-acetyltransferase [Streptomyces sp. SCUT-3]
MTAAPATAATATAPFVPAPPVPAPAAPGPGPVRSAPARSVPAAPAGTAPARYSVLLAADEDDVRAAQRLRHEVFAGEMGASLSTPVPGLDVDPFDAHCDHLLVREEATGEIVGTYRLLSPAGATAAGGLYSETEFDLSRLAGLRPALVEAGRSCVHPGHRDGAVVGLMWAGILRYLLERGHTWVAGCCSVPLADGGATAAGVWQSVRARHLSPAEYRVTPHRPWDAAGAAGPEPAARTAMPALLRGYLRLGAQVCGAPAHDPGFGVADLYVLLSLERTDPRYLRHFMSLGSAR